MEQTGFVPRGYTPYQSRLNTANGVLYFCTLNGRKYVVKEFSAFRFPTMNPNMMTPPVRKKYDSGMAYFIFLQNVTAKLHNVARARGLLNIPMEVFLQDGHVCKVSRFIEPCGIEPTEVSNQLDMVQVDQLIKSALIQLDQLREIHLVHGDLKPENLIICNQKNHYSVSVIDYDGGFFENNPPIGRDINFTPGYAAPEIQETMRIIASKVMTKEEAFIQVKCAADIFSLGCIWICFLTGQTPCINGDIHNLITADDLIVNELPYAIPLSEPFRLYLIGQMLAGNSNRRPGPYELLKAIRQAEQEGFLCETEQALEGSVQGYNLEGQKREMPGLACRNGIKGSEKVSVYLLCQVFSMENRNCDLMLDWIMKHREECFLAEQQAINTVMADIPQETILPYTIVRRGRLYYATQPLPKGKRVPLNKVHTLIPSPLLVDAMMIKLLEAADLLHKAGIVIGNLTEEHIIITYTQSTIRQEDGKKKSVKRFHVYLGGCFLAFLIGQVTDPKAMILDPTFNAPEVGLYRGAKDPENQEVFKPLISAVSDVFSFGLIYYLLLTGSLPPFNRRYAYFFSSRACPEEEDSAVRFDKSINKERISLIRSMTAYQPEDRIQSCGKAAKIIREIIGA